VKRMTTIPFKDWWKIYSDAMDEAMTPVFNKLYDKALLELKEEENKVRRACYEDAAQIADRYERYTGAESLSPNLPTAIRKRAKEFYK